MQKACSLTPPPDSPLESAQDPSGDPPEATLVYDGDCGFCARTVRHLRWHTGPSLEIVPYQAVLERFPDTPAEEFAEAVHLFGADGEKSRGAEAGLRALALLPGWSLPLWLYRKVPPLRLVSDWGYRRIAKNRYTISSCTTFLFGPPPLRRGQTLTRRLFEILIGLAVLVAAAFGDSDPSFGMGGPVLAWMRGVLGVFSLSLILGWMPKFSLYGMLLYCMALPRVEGMESSAERTDSLIFLTIAWAALYSAPAWSARSALKWEPSVFGLLVLRLLTLAFMITWDPWTVRQRVFEPEWIAVVTWTFPLLVFGPRRLRILGAAVLVLSQAVNAVQSGPRWENLFMVAMAIPLLDDAVLMRCAPTRLRERWTERLPLFRSPIHRSSLQLGLTVFVVGLVLAYGSVLLFGLYS